MSEHFAKNSENVESVEGLQYHLKVKPGDLARSVLLPGDPQRVQRIASHWDEAEKKAEYRQYVSYSGKFRGVSISSTSSGIGPAACEIALAELKNVGVDTIIRVGSCGALQEEIELGSVVISEGAVRLEDTSDHYVMKEYPAVASRMVTSALIQAAEELNIPYHVGITATSSSFYCGQGRPGYNGYLPSHRRNLVDDLTKAGVLNFEMEASLLFTMGKIYRMDVGAVSAVYANRPRKEFGVKGEENAIKIANEAVRIIEEDYRKRSSKHWY